MACDIYAVYLVAAALIAALSGALGITAFGDPSLDLLVRPLAMPDATDIFLMGVCSVIVAVAMTLLTPYHRLASASQATVLESTGMFRVTLWGLLFFAEVPKLTTLIGTVVIVAAGMIAVRSARA